MMKCEWVRDRLDDYLAGVQGPADAAATEEHLANCTDCSADLAAARMVAAKLDSLPQSRIPSTDLWVGIAARIGRGGLRRWIAAPAWSLLAAAILLSLGTGAATWVAVRQAAPPSFEGGGFGLAESNYHRSITDLSTLYARTRDSLAPETRALVERNLAVIEQAIREARAALEREPANALLESLVLAAYQRKLDFLEQATGLNRSG